MRSPDCKGRGRSLRPRGSGSPGPPTPARTKVGAVARHILGLKDDSPLHSLTHPVCGDSAPQPKGSARVTCSTGLARDWLPCGTPRNCAARAAGPRHMTGDRRSGSPQPAAPRFENGRAISAHFCRSGCRLVQPPLSPPRRKEEPPEPRERRDWLVSETPAGWLCCHVNVLFSYHVAATQVRRGRPASVWGPFLPNV